jgi:hypothetical protein
MRPALIVSSLVLFSLPALAQAPTTIVIRNHTFVPAEVGVPAGSKIELLVRNEQNTVAEFESTSLHREKIVPAGGQISVFLGPLEPGRYEFFDDFNQSTRGFLVVK